MLGTTSTRSGCSGAVPRRLMVRASFGQQPRPSTPIRPRGTKVVSAGGTVNFLDVSDERETTSLTVLRENVCREIKLNAQQRLVARKLQLFLQVDKQVAAAVAGGEILFYSPSLPAFPVVDTFAAIASGCYLSPSTFGKILSEHPEYAENTGLLKIRIEQLARVLSLKFDQCVQLVPKAPRLVSLPPKYWEGQLIQLSGVLCVDINLARLVVQREPRILTDGLAKLETKLSKLASVLAVSYTQMLALVCWSPSLLYSDLKTLEKKRLWLVEACSSHPCWLQQLADLPLYDLAGLLRNNGAPVFMRLKYLAHLEQQPHANLATTLRKPAKEFDEEWPQFEKWIEWNMPSYLFV